MFLWLAFVLNARKGNLIFILEKEKYAKVAVTRRITESGRDSSHHNYFVGDCFFICHYKVMIILEEEINLSDVPEEVTTADILRYNRLVALKEWESWLSTKWKKIN